MQSDTLSTSDTWTYGEWVDLLGGHFFTPEKAGLPVTFFVDEEILSALSDLPPAAAVASLITAITGVFGPLTEERAYDDISRATSAWERSGSVGYIRCLPLLALTVLAGTKMASEAAVRRTNYYRRYRALIGMDGGGQPPGYDTMPDLWDAYTRWLDVTLGGSLGLSTIGAPRFRRFISPALSQALFRASDRNELTYFLDSLGVPVTDEISGNRLVALFRLWAEWRGHFTDGARLLIKDAQYSELLEALIRDAARSWDGTVLDEIGRRESRILLHWNFEDGEPITTLAERPDGFPEALQIGSGSSTVDLTALSGTRFYREAPLSVDAALLQSGGRVKGGRFSFRLPARGIHILGENDEIPGWSSSRRFGWGRQHFVITDAVTAQSLRTSLEAGAEPGVIGPRSNPFLPGGWVIFRAVTPWPDAADTWAGTPLGQLVPLESPRPSLADGLVLSRNHVYLVGGEPDLVCPVDSFELDGIKEQAVPGSVVSLRGRGLPTGRHIVVAGGQRLRFATTHGTAGLTHEAAEPASLPISATASIRGALAPDEWSRNRWVRSLKPRRQYTAFGAHPGEFARLERKPAVSRTIGRLWAQAAEAEVPFEPVWLLIFDQRTGKSVKQVADIEPGPPTGTESSRRAWASFFLTALPGAPALWSRYRAEAEKIAGDDGAR